MAKLTKAEQEVQERKAARAASSLARYYGKSEEEHAANKAKAAAYSRARRARLRAEVTEPPKKATPRKTKATASD